VTESIVEPVTTSSGEAVTVPVTETATAVAEEVVTAEKIETIVTDEILVEIANVETVAVEVPETSKRGEGQGTGNARQGDGGATKCVCPKCGTEGTHVKGTPCQETTCPKCGEKMVGETEKAQKLRVKKENLLSRYHKSVKNLTKKIKDMKAENCKKLNKASEEVEFYKANSVAISERRLELGSYAKDLSDREIVDDNKFTDAKLVKANKEIEETAEIAGTKGKDADYYTNKRKEIDDKAFGRTKRQR